MLTEEGPELRALVVAARWGAIVDSMAELVHYRETRTMTVKCPWEAQAEGYKKKRRNAAEATLRHVGVYDLVVAHFATYGVGELMDVQDEMNALPQSPTVERRPSRVTDTPSQSENGKTRG